MPRGDRTGPMGLGPMTGRRAGYCAGYPVPGFANPAARGGLGLGLGFGGGGRGWRHMFYATGLPGWLRFGYPGPTPVAPENEAAILKTQADLLQKQLNAINKRLADLEQKQ